MRTGMERIQNKYENGNGTGTERISKGYRTGMERIRNRYRIVADQKK